MAKTKYGIDHLSYVVKKKKNGRIDVYVHHQNKAFRHKMENHKDNPAWFLDHFDDYIVSEIRAEFWLSQVITDYHFHFMKGLIDFVFIDYD